MPRVIYAFPTADIHKLAAELARALEVCLYPHQSPMLGPWYSSEDLAGVIQALKEGQPVGQPSWSLDLLLDETAPCSAISDSPRGTCLLWVSAPLAEQARIEEALRRWGQPVRRLSPQPD